MLHLLLLLHMLCIAPGDAFPQRANQHDQNSFDFDAYLQHFAPTQAPALDHPRAFSPQDYRYIPLLGETPGYVPPMLHSRGHFPHHSIPRRVVKHRSWHSTYQNGNFPTPGLQPVRHAIPPTPIQSLPRQSLQVPHFNAPTSNFNFQIHSKMTDLGEFEAPEVSEILERKEVQTSFHPDNDDYDIPEVLDVLVKNHATDTLKRKDFKDYIVAPIVPPKEISVVKDYIAETPNFKEQSPDEEYDYPVAIEAVVKVDTKEHHNRKEMGNIGLSEDYEEPVILEALTKVDSSGSKKRHQTKVRPIKKMNIKNRPMKSTAKPGHEDMPSYENDYEEPVVVNAFTKEELENSKDQVMNKLEKPVKRVTIEDNEPPVVQAFAKKYPDSSKGKIVHQSKEKSIPNFKEVPVPSDDYEMPIVVATFTKEELSDFKGHGPHQTKEKPKEEKMPIVNQTPTHYEDYEVPVVLEAFTKDELHAHTKGSKETSVKGKPVVKHDEAFYNSVDKPGSSSYIDYELPVVVEALTKEELFDRESGKKRTDISRHESSTKITKKNTHKQVESTEDYQTEQSDYKDLENYLLSEEGDYETLFDTKGEMDQDTIDDYVYEDLTEESRGKGLHHNGMKHTHKSTIAKVPVNTRHEVKDKNISKVPSVKVDDIYEVKDTTRSKKRFKRDISLDYEDYDYELPNIMADVVNHTPNYKKSSESDYEVPVIVEAVRREDKFVPENTNSKAQVVLGHKPNVVEHSPDEDYELPVIVETISKGVLEKTGELVQTNFNSEHDPVVALGYKTPNFVEQNLDEDYDFPVIIDPSKVHAHPKHNPGVVTKHQPSFVEPSPNDDYELPVVVETISKITKPSLEKLPSKMKPQINKDYESAIVIEALTKSEESVEDHSSNPKVETKLEPQSSFERVREASSDPYSRNKRERENYMEYQYPEHSLRQDVYERPIDDERRYEWHQSPQSYLEGEPPHKGENAPRNFDDLELSDNDLVLDSITINRESPDGREIPFLDILAVDDKVDSGNKNGLKVMAFNKDNGEVEAINVGHENSNHDISSLSDIGSGEIDERSIDSRSFLPLDSNSWSFMTHIQNQERRKFKPCLTPRNETGNCMPIQMCSVPNTAHTVEELLKNVCIIDEVFIGICCPEFPVETVSVDWVGRPDTEPLHEKGDDSPEVKECGKLPSTFGDKESWPWMAPLVSTTSDKVFCGGVLISEFYVLTAAHCTSRIPRNQILVRLQHLDSQLHDYAVVQIKRHAHYNPRTLQHDLALLRLSRRVALVPPVCLPDDAQDYVDEKAVLVRWQEKGAVESLSVISNHECQNRLGALVDGAALCTETRNDEAMCNADSGAPLVLEKAGQFQIIGTLTWNRNDCNSPTVFTRISSYLRWIRTHTK